MQPYDLDQPLMTLATSSGSAPYTARMSIEGAAIMGSSGAGKSSSSGRTIALNFLKAGWGGLVLTTKPDERAVWEEYSRLTGRRADLLVLEPEGVHSFNFLDYESQHAGKSGLTANLVQVLKTVLSASGEKESGKTEDPFWSESMDQILFNLIDLCKLAHERVSVQDLYEIVQTLPKNDDGGGDDWKEKAFGIAFERAREKVAARVDAWFAALPPDEQAQLQDAAAFEAELIEALPDARLLKMMDYFFFESLANLSAKTRSILDFTVSGFLLNLLREPVYSLFCRHGSTLTPEDSIRGKILLLDLPVKLYDKVGRDVQILVKYIWQRAMERRSIAQNGRPVFLWADEAQHFLHAHDTEFQATARSSRVATVYLSQNLPNYYASMGGAKAEYRVKAFLGTLGTKIFHNNTDVDTNRYASELIGDAYIEDRSESTTVAEKFSQTHSRSVKLERAVRPEEFQTLRTGTAQHQYLVHAYIHRQGSPLFKGRNYQKVAFSQQYLPSESTLNASRP
jgi:type IV secretory pathway TraG/TraD family ATPase VirD4